MTGRVALIVAAGRGHRMGGPLPKQYVMLGERRVLHHTVAAFAEHGGIDRVRAVIHPDDRPLYDDAVAGLAASAAAKLLPPAHGGATRQESVRFGLESLAAVQPDVVLIHDGARPLVSAPVIDRTLAALDGHDGAIAALRLSDTLKRQHGAQGAQTIAGTVDRAGLWRAQTPQTFRFQDILAAHQRAAGDEVTDDAAVAELAGLSVALVEGADDNLKITTADDVTRAEQILAARGAGRQSATAPAQWDLRVGMGFDVHRFGPGDHIMLCGVKLPHDRGVLSHSDGDVALHALVDAILGAIGAGDIGTHFPPSDPAWRDAASEIFVHRAMELLVARGGELTHVDLTVICERPKIGVHRAAMTARLAGLLGLAGERIGLKATTTERLGFTGRGEGIAVQALATVRLPLVPAAEPAVP
jgi:2-C-methyl-D-erythritol 4-phosphate cytidylyltransferase/2-C-methyl-D-erythritol 2,4-cyclodiphosphate synthase